MLIALGNFFVREKIFFAEKGKQRKFIEKGENVRVHIWTNLDFKEKVQLSL